MGSILSLILPMMVPILADGVKAVFNYFTGGAGAQPANVDEAIRLMEAEAKKLKAIAELDAPADNISKWVADLRASFRYIAAGVIMVPVPFLVAYAMYLPTVDNMNVLITYTEGVAGPVFAFMFGDRLRLAIRKS